MALYEHNFDQLIATAESTSTSTAYVITCNEKTGALAVGDYFRFRLPVTIGAAATVALNGLAAVPLFNNSGVAIPAGAIKEKTEVDAYFDGTNMVLTSGYDLGGATTQAKIGGATSAYTALTTDSEIVVDATTQDITITLVATGGKNSDSKVDIKKVNTTGFDVIVVPPATKTIDGATTFKYPSKLLASSFELREDTATGNWWKQ